MRSLNYGWRRAILRGCSWRKIGLSHSRGHEFSISQLVSQDLLDGDALTDLQLLISSAPDVRPPLKLLLVGQEPLRAILRRAQHADLANLVSVRYQPRPFSREQTSRYIDFQHSPAGTPAASTTR
ncbi:MAG: hypothetical protein ACYC3X_20245 [Pirellulaceae bacterium]